MTLNPGSFDSVSIENAAAVLLDRHRWKWTIDGHIITRDRDGIWWTDPYGTDRALYEQTPADAERLIGRLLKYPFPLSTSP